MKKEDYLTYQDILQIPRLICEYDSKKYRLRDFISKPNEVFLLGRGSSGNATLFAKYIWESYCGIISNIVHPFSIFNLKKKLNMKKRTLFSFSQSGRSYDVVECSKRLKSMGATLISITNEPDIKKNKLAGISNFSIILSSSPEIAVAATKSFILQLWSVLRLSKEFGSGFSEKDFKRCLCEIEYVIKNYQKILKGIDLSVFLKSRVVAFVGRGPFNAVAEDSALKFREMAQIQSLGYSAAEFLHGPVGAFCSDDFVVILSGKKKLSKDLLLVEDKLKEKKVRYMFLTPFSDDYPFNALSVDVFIKLLAFELSLVKGLNPDNPKGLSKITHTF